MGGKKGIVKFSSRDYLTYVCSCGADMRGLDGLSVCLFVYQIRDMDLHGVSCFALGIRIDYSRITSLPV